MEEYHDLVRTVLEDGQYKPNRTGVDTISYFGYSYTLDNDRYPLLTTKKMDGFRWNSMIHELLWYLSGEEHIRNLREETKIWDAWADEEGKLDTAYGRFWRRYPVPSPDSQQRGESWVNTNGTDSHKCVDWESQNNYTFDQIQYIIDTLRENPNSRRMVLNAWHPANASVSTLPPCHFTSVFNVQGDELNLHLTQRSGDVALGVPFNIACYTLLQRMMANQVDGLEVGKFHHTIVDAHIYCGEGERGEWYEEQDDATMKTLLSELLDGEGVSDWIEHRAPNDPDNLDHVPGLLKQIKREPYELPTIDVAEKDIDSYERDDFELKDYESHGGVEFGVAE